jgi:hypothetical protein
MKKGKIIIKGRKTFKGNPNRKAIAKKINELRGIKKI